MNREITVFLGESVGAFFFSLSAGLIIYLYAQSSNLSSVGSFDINVIGNAHLYAYYIAILFTWVGMLVGGVIGVLESLKKPSKIISIVISITIGVFFCLITFLKFNLKENTSSFFSFSLLVLSLIFMLLSGLVTSYIINHLKDVKFSNYSQILITLTGLILPLLTVLLLVLTSEHAKSNLAEKPLQMFLPYILFPSVLIIPPMLILWAMFLSISNFISKEINNK
jgi:hypothetical protein